MIDVGMADVFTTQYQWSHIDGAGNYNFFHWYRYGM